MVHIITNTGKDEQVNRGSKGYVFLFNPVTKSEEYIFYSSAELIDEDTWVGQWRKQMYDVVDGAIIKLSGGMTLAGHPCDYASAYFIVREGSPIVKASCKARGEQKGYIIGPLKSVTYAEIGSKLGFKIKAQYKKYYRNNGIIVETTEEPLHLNGEL